MKWGLTQGMMGKARSLSPSLTAIGPNTYLTRTDFLRMIGAAVAIHAVFFIAAALMPSQKVTNIPVRALSFRLGDQDRVAAIGTPQGSASAHPVAAPVMSASASFTQERYTYTPPPQPVVRQVAPAPKPAPIVPVKPAKITPLPTEPAQYAPPVPTTPAIAPVPQQYVREVGGALQQLVPLPGTGAAPGPVGLPNGTAGGAGAQNTQVETTERQIRERYEQQISSWIDRHKFYPAEAGGRSGRVEIRMRIDRSGIVRYYALEESSGVPAIDAAALDMVRRANPVPAVPENYPAGNLVEFLIPITFKAPQ